MGVAAISILLITSSCSDGDDGEQLARHGSLTDAEYDVAVDTAKQVQSEVNGTFVGATAIASDQHRAPCDRDAGCPNKRLVYIRLVWDADASFEHSGLVDRPDGQYKALLIALDAGTGDIVSRGAMYRAVAPDDAETLLYGRRL